MRIIAGKYGRRRLEVPKSFSAHPMGDRIRSAMFNSLGDLSDSEVWDAFAGSGLIGFEAVSRGAKYALMTEKDRKVFQILLGNLSKINDPNIQAVNATAKGWSNNNVEKKFDIIFCDPPYNNLQLSTVFALKKHLKPKGLMLLSYPGREPVPIADGVVVVDNRNYGNASLATYHLAE